MADYYSFSGKGYTPTQNELNNPYVTKWSDKPVPTGPDGKPLGIEFNSMGDPRTGLLRSPYNIQSDLNTGAINQLRSEALRQPGSMSRWGQMALTQGQNQNAMQNAGATAQAQNQLAMQGGLRSGARERIARAGQQNTMAQNQNVWSNIAMQDEKNRQQQLQALPGMELQQANYLSNIQDKNIGRALSEVNTGRQMQQQQFNEAMRAWAAGKTADAQSNASRGSSGFFNDDIPLLGWL